MAESNTIMTEPLKDVEEIIAAYEKASPNQKLAVQLILDEELLVNRALAQFDNKEVVNHG